jgi:hypothetical protein
MSEAHIKELITEPDTLEIVRDQIAAILSLELQNQYAIAVEDGAANAAEYHIPVYVENTRPYEAGDDNPLPRFVNVLLPKVDAPEANPRLGMQKEQAVFWIDCCARGNDGGNFRDDRSAGIRAWKVTRLVRRILMSDYYTYLGLRGTVGSRIVTSMEAGTPEKISESALAYVIIRVTVAVQFLEKAIEAEGFPLEAIDWELDPASGELRAIGG